jgi:hypothetical protein
MLSRAYVWLLQANFAESSLARRVPLSRLIPRPRTPIATTALPFSIRLEADGVMGVRLVALTRDKGSAAGSGSRASLGRVSS